MPLRGGAHLVLVLFASLGVACATPLDVTFDEEADFSRYRTWDWLPLAARRVDAPAYDVRALERRLAALVDEGLRAQGFRRAGDDPDLRVGVQLQVRSRTFLVNRTGATQFLSSFSNASPSYLVKTTEQELRSIEQGRLLLFALDAESGGVLWRGVVQERHRETLAPHLADMVRTLLARFPPEPTEPAAHGS